MSEINGKILGIKKCMGGGQPKYVCSINLLFMSNKA